MIKKIIKLFLFLLGIYLAIISFLSFSLFFSFKNKNLVKAKNRAKLLNSLTVYSDKIHLFPFSDLNKISSLSLDFILIYDDFSQILSRDFSTNWPQTKSLIIKTIDNIESLENDLSKPILFILNKFFDGKINFTKLSQEKEKILELIEISDILLGIDSPQKYTIILQNNMELRATGGFMGSYAQLTIDKAKVVSSKVEDIYVPDGQLIGHVNPPKPIQDAFQTGVWKLRDANWSPDFPIAAKNILWFFQKGGEDPGTNLIAINLSVAEEFMQIIGPVYLSDYDQEVNSTNLYAIAQSEAETDFFPGSTQKKDFLNSLFKLILIKLKDLSPGQILDIINLISNNLEDKNIQAFSQDEFLQNIFLKNSYAGQIDYPDLEYDYQFIVESNLGANKANCCTSKSVSQKVIDQGDFFDIFLTIDIKNDSIYSDPRPPKYWGGDYRNYFRIYLPQKAQVKKISFNKENLNDEEVIKNFFEDKKLSQYGFFANVPHKSQGTIDINYQLPKLNKDTIYNLIIQKQSGAKDFYQEIELVKGDDSQKIKRLIEKDTSLLFN